MAEVFIYAPDAEDMTTIGYGALRATSCTFSEAKNDASYISVTVPMWEDNTAWTHIEIGAKVRVAVPTRTIPDIDMNDPDNPLRQTTAEVYTVKALASKDERTLYKKATGDQKIKRFKPGKKVTVMYSANDERYKVNTSAGTGFMLKSGLDYEITETVPDTNTGIETVLQPVKNESQIFRIVSVEYKINEISFTANHIFYDLAENLTYYTKGTKSAGQVIKGILDNCKSPVDFEFVTDTGDIRTIFDYDGINPVLALLDPDTGVAGRWNLELVRNNYNFALLRNAGANRGGIIEYGKNMVSLDVSEDLTDVVTHIVPVGKTKKGKKLYLNTETQAVVSPKAADYPVEKWVEIDYSDDGCVVTDKIDATQVRAELKRLAEREFSENHVDVPQYEFRVNHIDIGDTIEFSQYYGLDRIYLYDIINIRSPFHGINVNAEVTKIEYDCLAERVTGLELGSIVRAGKYRTIPSWEVPRVSGDKLLTGTIPPGSFQPGAINEDDLADGSVNARHIVAESVTADKIAAGTITAGQIAAGSITTALLDAGAVTAEKIAAKTITAEQCVANMITAQSGLIAVGAIETAQIADGSITSAKIVSLNADVIQSGTLKTDRLLLVGEGGVIYEINAASSGLSQSELSKEQYQNYINGTVIVANSITAAQIAAGAITANEIAANAVTAAKVNIADLFAAQATINAINAMDISSNTYLKLFVGQSIDAVSVGGRNLLLNTASPNSLTGTGAENEGKTFYWLSRDYTGNRPKQGEYLTLSFNWSTTATSGTITPQWNNTPYNMTAPAITISASNKAGHYTYTWQMRASDVSGTYTGVQVRLDNVSGTVMISGMKLERGNKATDWTPAPEDPVEALKNSTVTIMPDEVTITTPQFNVDIQKDIASEASRALQIDSDGIRAQTIISDSVVGALLGGNYTVGTGGDYARLEDAIAEINDRHIRGDVYIKLRDWNIGENPTIAGVTGSGRIYLMPQNLMDINSGARWESQGATASANLGASVAPFTGVTVTAQSAGTYRGALLHQGYAGPMGIIGKTLTISANIEGSSGTVPNIVTYLGGKGLQWLGPATSGAAANTYTGFIRIPETAGFWDELTFLFRINATTSVNAGAQGFFRSLRLEIGDGLGDTSYPSYAQLAGLKVENCAAEVIVKGLKLSGAILARHSHVTAICCGMYADTGMRAWGGSGGMVDCYGVCTTIAEGAGGGAIEVYGVAPSGNTLGSVDTSRMTDRDSSGTPPSGGKSISVYAQTTGTYDTNNGWWSSDRALRQGYTASNGRMRGGMWFDLSALPSGATITKLTLRLKRVAGFGKGAPVDIRIYGTTAEARAGDPAASGKISSAFVTGSINQDVTKSFNITTLKAYSGFVLYATDTSLLSGKTYSTNYAKFTGTGGGDSTTPMLTVDYTI